MRTKYDNLSHSLVAGSRARGATILVIGLLACKTGLAQVTSTAMPAEVAELKLPSSFVLVDSTNRATGNQTTTTVRFKASLSPELSRAVVQAGLTETGWKRDETMSVMEVFIDPYRPQPSTFCRNDRWLTFSASGAPGTSDVFLSVQAAGRRTCDSIRSPDVAESGLLPHLPDLEAPTDPSTGRLAALRPGGGSFGAGTAHSQVMIQYANVADASSQFARQMASQEWTRDASWAGAATAGSSWSKRIDEQHTIHGMMQLIDLGHGRISAQFTAANLSSATPTDEPGKRVPQALTGLIFQSPTDQPLLVSRNVPPGNSDFRIPAQFELVGTASPRSDGTTTAFRTALPILAAREIVLESLAATGWKSEVSTDTEEVFLIPNRPRTHIVCRNAARRLIHVQEIDDARYVAVTTLGRTDAPRSECQSTEDQFSMPGSSVLRSAAPRLEFPASARTVPGEVPMNYESNGRTLMNRIRFQSPDSPGQIAQHLAPQLAKLGWERDAEWSTARSAGSTWRRRNESGPPIWSELQIVNLGNGIFDVRLQLMVD
jgi:hypothetical protein